MLYCEKKKLFHKIDNIVRKKLKLVTQVIGRILEIVNNLYFTSIKSASLSIPIKDISITR